MLLQTNLIGRLTDKGLTVAVVCQNVKDENFAILDENPNVTLVEWNPKSSLWDEDYLYKRMYYLEDIQKNTALEEKFYNSLFYSKSLHPWRRIRPLIYYSVYKLTKVFPTIRTNFLKRESKHLASKEAASILSRINPSLLVSTYPVSLMEAKMLHTANIGEVSTLLHLLSWDNITCKGQFPAMADRFIVWGDIMKEELQEHYRVPEERISKCGVPHFDQHIEVKRDSTDQGSHEDTQNPYLFFAMSSPRFAPKEIDIVEWLSKAITRNEFGTEMNLVVRPHPQNVQSSMAKASWLDRLQLLESDRIIIDYPKLTDSSIRWSMKKDDMIQLSKLIAGCSVCLNSGSTVSIDALMHDRPVVLTSFDGDHKLKYWHSARRLKDYTHLKKFIAEGGAQPVSSYQELKDVIKAYLQNPNHDIEERRNALLRECYSDDGKSTERVVESLSLTLKEIA